MHLCMRVELNNINFTTKAEMIEEKVIWPNDAQFEQTSELMHIIQGE